MMMMMMVVVVVVVVVVYLIGNDIDKNYKVSKQNF